jgi:transcriptional regulator with XRE-family HTH domain
MTGQSIRRIRRALGLTQAEFGTLFGIGGGAISRWETGTLVPTDHQVAMLERLGRATKVSKSDIGEIISQSGAIIALSVLLADALKVDGPKRKKKTP